MGLLDKVKELCEERSISQRKLEKDLKLGNGASSKWTKSSPSGELLQKIADYFGVQLDWLNGTSEFRTKEEWLHHLDETADLPKLRAEIDKWEKGTLINVLGEVAAGVPIEAIQDIVDTEEISEELAKTGQFFGLRIKGNSMSPRIAEGDTVIVRKQDYAETGDVVIALVNGESATCKRLMKYEEGISLLSYNPTYEPMNFTSDQIQSLPITIIGKVVENRQKY